MKLPSISSALLSTLKPAMPKWNLKKSITLMLIVVWCVALVWLWLWGAEYQAFNVKPFESLLTRWLLTTALVIIAMIWAVWWLTRRLNRLILQQQQSKEEVKDPAQHELNRQNRYLSRWLLRLQKQLATPKYLYRRPWYLVIGNKGSGKTTLLKESCKLNALYDPDLESEQHYQRYVNCWLNDRAVIIEADGLLIDQPNQGEIPRLYSRLWMQLLNWCLTERSRQPLNGVILTVDIHQFCTFDKHQREQYLASIKERLTEISKTLHCKLPVYVVLTKLDLMYGFEAMYQSLDKTERDAMLGITFSTDDNGGWKEELQRFWQQWMSQLNQAIVPSMMLHDVDVGQRSQLFTFTRQMHGIKDYVTDLVDKCLYTIENKPLLLRGIYLTSSLQQGQMEDLFVKSASSQYGLPEQVYPTWQNSLLHTYFTHDLFNNHLFSEPNLASENAQFGKQKKRSLLIFTSATSLVMIGVIAGWQYYYQINHRAGQEVLVKAREYMNIASPTGRDLYGNLQLPLLDPMGKATVAYGNYHDRSKLLSDLGLYQGYKIGPYVESTYLRLLQQRFLPAIMNGLMVDLNKAPNGSEEKLRILRIMRMIEDESGRDKDLVAQHMAENWSKVFKGQREVQQSLNTHLYYALAHIDWKDSRTQKGDRLAMEAYLPFEQTLKNAQIDLRKLSIHQRVYQNLHARARSQMPIDLNISNQIGASFDTVFSAENPKLLNVPQLLTRTGLINYFVHQDEQLINLTSLDSWVLNITANVHYSEADREEIRRQITTLYLNDYASTWNAAYNNIHIRNFENIPAAISALEQVISGEQVFRRAIVLLKENTEPQELTVIADSKAPMVNEIVDKGDRQLISRISREFVAETGVLNESNGQTSALQHANQKLTDLHRYLLSIQNSPNPGRAALQAVQLRLNKQDSDPILELQQLAKGMPSPLGRWLDEMATAAWNVVMIEAIRSLEIEWNDKVVSQYKQVFAGRYPFNPQSNKDVPLSEFERFFGPNGTLDSFYQQNLKPFVENNLGSNVAGKSLIRPDVLHQLAQAEKIRRTYFSQQGLGIRFSIQPIGMSGNKRRGVLNLDGQLVEYRQASTGAVRLIWPNSMRESIESKLTLVGNANFATKNLTYTGPWGLVRLINSGKLTNVQNNSFDIRYDLDGGYVIYRVYIDESDNPFAGGLFSQFNLPSTLY